MDNISQSKEEYQEDALRRIDQILDRLEERFTALLSSTDPTSSTCGQRTQTVSRLCTLMMRLLELRSQYAELDES